MAVKSRGAPRAPRLLAISDLAGGGRLEDEEALAGWIEALSSAGVEALQIREKALDDRRLHDLTRRVVELARGRLDVVVNGRPDIALAAGAQGVHLPSSGLPPGPLRRRWPRLLLGLSTHSDADIEAAGDAVDYVTFGPVYATPSKARYGPPRGLEALRRACRLGVPVLALGGVGPGQLSHVAGAGAAGAAAIRALLQPATLVEMATAASHLWPRDP